MLEYGSDRALKKMKEGGWTELGGKEMDMEIYEYGTMAKEVGLSMPPPEP